MAQSCCSAVGACMERPSFVTQHGVLRLPPGFRFHPTDEEIVVEYLRRKVLRFPLPAAVIPEINLGKHADPWDLPGLRARACPVFVNGGSHGEGYFFSPGEAIRPNSRATCSGYWKPVGKDMPVRASSQCNAVVGMKKVLVFHRGKHPRGSPTNWIMHEYRLVTGAPSEIKAPGFAPRKKSQYGHEMAMPKQQICTGRTEDWVVCHLFRKRSKQTELNCSQLHKNAGEASRIDPQGIAAATCSSGSSCITDDTSEEGDIGSSDDAASSPCEENALIM